MSATTYELGKAPADAATYTSIAGHWVHRLKCWADNFDALAGGLKKCEIRHEDDRKFKAGDCLELTRTDVDGNETQPRTLLIVEVCHVERFAGPLDLVAIDTKRAAGMSADAFKPIAVLSIAPRMVKLTDEPAVSK